MRKRIIKSERVDISEYEADNRDSDLIADYDEDLEEFSLDELEEMGVISYPKTTKIIDGEGYYHEWY